MAASKRRVALERPGGQLLASLPTVIRRYCLRRGQNDSHIKIAVLPTEYATSVACDEDPMGGPGPWSSLHSVLALPHGTGATTTLPVRSALFRPSLAPPGVWRA